MGARGPQPTPSAILKTRGTFREDRCRGEPRPEPGKPPCPKSLSKPARALWRRLCNQLDAMGVLSKIDWAQLERYCVYFIRWQECEVFIAKNGMTYPVKSDDPKRYVGKLAAKEGQTAVAVIGFEEYPQVKESHRLDKALKQIEASFGLTPSARTRLTVPDRVPADDAGGHGGKNRFFGTVG